MGLDRSNDSFYAFPLVSILGFPSDYIETFKDIDYVIYPSSLNSEFSSALIQVE